MTGKKNSYGHLFNPAIVQQVKKRLVGHMEYCIAISGVKYNNFNSDVPVSMLPGDDFYLLTVINLRNVEKARAQLPTQDGGNVVFHANTFATSAVYTYLK